MPETKEVEPRTNRVNKTNDYEPQDMREVMNDFLDGNQTYRY
jgi:hypothetical protein